MTIPALFILPQGLTVTGVNTWAVTLSEQLRQHDVAPEIIAHGSAAGHAHIDRMTPSDTPVHTPDLPDIETLRGDVWPMVDAYRPIIDALFTRHATPVMLIPTRHGDCFGACAALASIIPDRVRLIGWRHSPLGYETAVLKHYEPVVAAYAAVSSHLAGNLEASLPGRRVHLVPNAVRAPEDDHAAPQTPKPTNPLSIISTGRLDQPTKRVRALIEMSDALLRRGVDHHLTIVGDGPERRSLLDLASERPAVTIAPPCTPEELRATLKSADVFVLASRVEGMSMSVLEAMAAGCPCVITETPSGAADLIPDNDHGILVPRLHDADDHQLGAALADGVNAAIATGLPRLARNAQARVRGHFNLESQTRGTCALFEAAIRRTPKRWPSDRGYSFSSAPGGSGSTPADAADRMTAALSVYRGRPVAIHGTGRHSADLIRVFEASPAPLAAFIDDDPSRWGTRFAGMPVVSPATAASLGIDAVIISSWMHEAEIFDRRSIYERHGIRVVRLYPPVHVSGEHTHHAVGSAA